MFNELKFFLLSSLILCTPYMLMKKKRNKVGFYKLLNVHCKNSAHMINI